jgi:TrmH family RNA methyltransferase
MTNEGVLDTFHVVLVEPEKSLNVGAVARAMTNLGFHNLHLVAPREYDRKIAEVTACWGTPLLDTLVTHETLEAAVSDMTEVVGLSGRDGISPALSATLPEWIAGLPGRASHKTALVFGPEDNGLRQEHLNQCRRVIRIPSTIENPSFNLAQSVLLVLYEITKSLPDAAPTIPVPSEEAPTWNDYFQLNRLLDAVMTESGFVREGTPAPVPGVVKNLFRRLEMTPQEMGILLGLFGKVNTNLRRNR